MAQHEIECFCAPLYMCTKSKQRWAPAESMMHVGYNTVITTITHLREHVEKHGSVRDCLIVDVDLSDLNGLDVDKTSFWGCKISQGNSEHLGTLLSRAHSDAHSTISPVSCAEQRSLLLEKGAKEILENHEPIKVHSYLLTTHLTKDTAHTHASCRHQMAA